ncbi:MAG TPA: hypothetical protein PLK32_08175 [Defluviitoga tunisiensis]|nr:hypothetical protein [Defluviitoga tunisiensis]
MHLTTDHPDSSYGIPVWVDKEGRSYGQLGDLIFGYIFLPDENEEETK